mgnify:CR=1 FL=1
MAKTWVKTNLKLVLQYEAEVNGEMKTKTKSKTYSSVMENANVDDLYEVGASLASLQEYDLAEIQEIITNVLEQ